MASVLKVDSITGVTTAGSISVTGEGNSTTTNLQQGLCKVFITVDQTGTTTNLESFNVASIVDNGTSMTTSNFSNIMNNAVYVYNLSRDRTGSQNGGIVQNSSNNQPTSASLRFNCWNESFASQDVDRACLSIHGDLA